MVDFSFSENLFHMPVDLLDEVQSELVLTGAVMK